MHLSTIAPLAPLAATTTAPALPPLQDRTPEQLREGMVVDVRGAGSDDIAVARLIQDGAQYMARVAGTTMGLATVEVNYKRADQQGALGLATFRGNSGWFALSQRSTSGLLEGIERLRTTDWAQWTEAQRQAFIQANETILHEAAHVTLNGYTSEDVRAWRSANRDFEEGLSEVATMTHIRAFMQDEFGIELSELSDRISQSTSAYTRFSERISRMLGMGTDGSRQALAAAASYVGDKVRADERIDEIARRMGAALGGADAPQELVEEIARTLPGFVAERNGTRTKLMEIQAALVDHKAGNTIADPGGLVARLRAEFDDLAGNAPFATNGDEPIA